MLLWSSSQSRTWRAGDQWTFSSDLSAMHLALKLILWLLPQFVNA